MLTSHSDTLQSFIPKLKSRVLYSSSSFKTKIQEFKTKLKTLKNSSSERKFFLSESTKHPVNCTDLGYPHFSSLKNTSLKKNSINELKLRLKTIRDQESLTNRVENAKFEKELEFSDKIKLKNRLSLVDLRLNVVKRISNAGRKSEALNAEIWDQFKCIQSLKGRKRGKGPSLEGLRNSKIIRQKSYKELGVEGRSVKGGERKECGNGFKKIKEMRRNEDEMKLRLCSNGKRNIDIVVLDGGMNFMNKAKRIRLIKNIKTMGNDEICERKSVWMDKLVECKDSIGSSLSSTLIERVPRY